MNPVLVLILELLFKFLMELFQRWLDNKLHPSPEAMLDAEKDFLRRVKWRIWLGPKRMDTAAELFAKAHTRYVESRMQYDNSPSAKEFATGLTEGL